MTHTVVVDAPSRLHFGMLSFGRPEERQFGGVGAMLTEPGLRIQFSAARSFDVSGPLAERTRQVVQRTIDAGWLTSLPACHVRILAAPPEHVGLGTGTQLGLAVVAGLNAWLGREPLAPVTLAPIAGRGERSAIGAYGFFQGGLLVAAGKHAGQTLSPLVGRAEFPPEWQFVLLRPAGERGLSGDAERRAFQELPPTAPETTAALCREVLLHLLPAAAEGRFEEFSESLYRYGHLAGLCFAPKQGGPYASERLARLIETMQALGVRGVGQSSWGPTLFALLPHEAAAVDFIDRLRAAVPSESLEVQTARPSNHGARIELRE